MTSSQTTVMERVLLSKRSSILKLRFVDDIKKHLNSLIHSVSNEDALNSVIYGIKCARAKRRGTEPAIIFQHGSKSTQLSLAMLDIRQLQEFDLTQVDLISFDPTIENFKDKSLKEGTYIHIFVNKKSIDLIFNQPSDLNNFVQGILILIEGEIESDEDFLLKNKAVEENIKKLWQIYDKDFSNKLDRQEFSKFAKELNINFQKTSTLDELFMVIDKDQSGYIDYNEFVDYYMKFTSGGEYKKVFNIYSSGKGYLTAEDLVNFYKEEQKENVELRECEMIILLHKQGSDRQHNDNLIQKLKGNVKLTDEEVSAVQMTLDEFKIFINDADYTSIYDHQKRNDQQNMNRPLNDYLISSTHNTYLTGHQLHGQSSVEMYNYSLLRSYRLVELDCWNGGAEGPVITHGYTFASTILLKDVLADMRKNAFTFSEYPVILSIENHCDAQRQKVMAEYFLKYLQDLYILDEDNLPEYYPSPNQLKGKFIVKNSGKRIQIDRSALKPRKEITYDDTVTIETSRSPDTGKPHTQKPTIDKQLLINQQDPHFDKTDQDPKDFIKQKKRSAANCISELESTRGMCGTKFFINKIHTMNFQPWEMVSAKGSKFRTWTKDFQSRKLLIDYTQNSFMKAYPENFDSSNYDIVKVWMCGAQVAAINVQATKDDWTLLNQVFFKMNRNCGYILKPKKFLPESIGYEDYSSPAATVQMALLSAWNMHLVLKSVGIHVEPQYDVQIKITIIGSHEDEQYNEDYTASISGNLLFPTISMDKTPLFKVYEKDFACVFLRMTYNEKQVGRSVIPIALIAAGIRTVPVFDDFCEEYPESYLVFRITKTFF